MKSFACNTFGCARFVYNKMLSDKIKYYEEIKQKLDNTLHNTGKDLSS